jgi:ABC-2 type transport system permease protein
MSRRWLTVAVHEYLRHVLHPGFLLFTFGFPVLLILVSVGVGAIAAVSQSGESKLGYVDRSGVLNEMPEKKSEGQTTLLRYPDEGAARSATQNGELDGYLVVPEDYVSTGDVAVYAPEGLPEKSRQVVGEFLQGALAERAGTSAPERLGEPISGVEEFSAATGEERSTAGEVSRIVLPYLFSILYFIAVLSSSSYLLLALVEEKENRLMEILGTSMGPGGIMAGKILGFGLVGLTPVAVWAAGIGVVGVVALLLLPAVPELGIPPWPLLLGAFMLVVAYFLISGLLTAIGTAVTSTQESQQFAGPVSLLVISPLFILPAVFVSPNGALAVAASLFPPTAPAIMLQRLLVGEVPAYQIALSVALLLISAVAAIWVAGRVFRFGMLQYGKRLSLRELGRAISR